MTENYDWGKEYRWNITANLTSNKNVWENGFNRTEKWSHTEKVTYITVTLILLLLCIVATIINARILLCVKWIRRPLSPTLYISLSLALVDTCTAILIGLGFIFNCLLPNGLNINVDNDCLYLTLEALRLSGILISTFHLLVLAGNQYFGILSPFRSMRWMTHTNLTVVLIFVYIFPTAYIFVYFGSFKNEGFQQEACRIEESHFIKYSRFRTIYSTIFFIPLIIMFAIYIHISKIVRKHQASRRWYNRYSRRHEISGCRSNQERQFDRNLKALWTSLLILSTYIICFMPEVLYFYLVCNDCYFSFEALNTQHKILTNSILNFLLIGKYLVNPLIYASRMNEIRVATKQMNADLREKFCNFGDSNHFKRTSSLVEGTQRISVFSNTSRRNHEGHSFINLKNGMTKTLDAVQATDL